MRLIQEPERHMLSTAQVACTTHSRMHSDLAVLGFDHCAEADAEIHPASRCHSLLVVLEAPLSPLA